MEINIGEATSFGDRYNASLCKHISRDGDSTKNVLYLVDKEASLLGRVSGRNRRTIGLGNFIQYAQVGGKTQRLFIEPQNLRFDETTNMLHIDIYRILYNEDGFTTQKETKTFDIPSIFA